MKKTVDRSDVLAWIPTKFQNADRGMSPCHPPISAPDDGRLTDLERDEKEDRQH